MKCDCIIKIVLKSNHSTISTRSEYNFSYICKRLRLIKIFIMESFKITKKATYTLVEVLVERLDIQTAPSLKSALVQLNGNREKNIVLDLSNCSYCDSSGLSAILVAFRLCKNTDGMFVLCGLQEVVERLITISQLDVVLTIVSNQEKAEELILNK